MSTRIASIGVGKLSTTSRYVESFIVEIYSDAGYTVKIDAKVSGARWNGTVSVQTDYIQFDGLTFGTTYFLRAGVVTPVSGVISTWTTFNTAAGTSSAPGCTYSGTFTATTSGIGYVVTPASVPTDIDHFEAVWQFDNTVPANTTIAHWSGQQTNGVITFFVGGTPGQIAKVYLRGVNTAQQSQAWQLIDTRTVSTTWSGTTIGTIGDGTLLGTGGPSVNSASTGRLALAGAVGAAFLTGFGSMAAMSSAGNTGFNSIDTTPSTGRTYEVYSGSGLYVNIDNTAGVNRTFLNSSGQYSVGGGAISDSFISAIGSTGGAPGRLRVSGSDSFIGVTGTTPAQAYGIYNTSGVLHDYSETSATQLTYLNSGGSLGIGASPVNKLNVFGSSDDGLLISNPQPSVFYADSTVGSRQYQQYGLSNNFSVWDNTATSNRLILNSSGQYGIDGSPTRVLDVYGAAGSIQGSAAQIRVGDTQVSGVDGNLTSGTTTAGTVYIYRNGSPVQFLSSSGMGIGATPTQPLYLSGDAFWHIGPSATTVTQGTNTGGRTFETATGAAHAMLDGQYGWNDVTAGSNRMLLTNAAQIGIGMSPSQAFAVATGFLGVNLQGTQPSVLYTDSGNSRNWGFGARGGPALEASDETASLGRLFLNTSGQYGIGVTPSFQLDASGQVFSRTSGAAFSALDRTGSNFVTLYSTGAIPRLWWNGSDFTTFNPSTGAMGLGGTYTGDWISVQGTSILDGSKVLQANLANADKIAADGTTYGRIVNTYLSSNRPVTNFADTFHVNKNLDNVNDTATYQRKRPASPRAVDTPYNSDFEIWVDGATAGDGWTTAFEVTGTGSTYSRGTGFFGNFGQSIASTTGNGGSVASRPVPVRPNTKYELSARYISNVATTQGVFIRINWYSSDNAFDSASRIGNSDTVANGAATTSWAFATSTFTSPSTAKYAVVSVYCWAPNVNATFTFDSVNIRPADVAQVDVGVDASGNLLFKNLNNASASTSSATQSSNVYAVVPEMSVTITTKGNKVLLNFSGSFSMNATGTPCFFAIFRDGTQISPEFQQTPANVLIFTQACTFIDTGASAASHTFDVRWRTSGGGNTVSIAGTNRAFQVVELG